jgi:serine/threonine protein kinase/tetratricopeptide (TPR) repeat protein
MSSLVGKTILHYNILEKLGEGGMGVVYLAEDTKLDRKVAIKFLPHHISGNSDERKRFEIEAKAAASLNHPNIATIYAIEEYDNELFIVMEYIDGQELKDRIDAGSLSVEESIDISIQIAKGLKAAHNAGIVHRDIKSSNIMLKEDDQVKVMDFGLAKVRGGKQITKVETTLGTAAYMSPEQTSGDAVDHRSDIWSLGVLVYEMLTGQLPFKGDYDQAITYSILNEEQQPLTGLRTGIPMEMERIVNKCLQKNPSDRYQHVDEFIVDLRQLKKESETNKLLSKTSMSKNIPQKHKRSFVVPGIIAAVILLAIIGYIFFSDEADSTERISIAVADFVNQTNESELDGLSGMLITALEQSRRLAVITRSRMFDILGQMGKKDVEKIDEILGKQICLKANISVIVVASIRKFGKLYTIDLKALDPFKDEYILTAKEEAEGQESIPSMLDDLSEKTRVGLKERIAQVKETSQNIASVTTNNLEAYQHFFQGDQLINQLKFEEAIKEFKKAVTLDSSFVQAYYRLAYAESWEYDSEMISKNHLERALKNINRMPERERYLVRAQNAIIDNNYKIGIAILKEMEQIYPDDKEMIYNIGDWSYHLADYETAITYLIKTLKIDPNHQRAIQHLIWTYRDMKDYDKAIFYAKQLAPSIESFQTIAIIYNQMKLKDKALEVLQSALEIYPENINLKLNEIDNIVYAEKYEEAIQKLKVLIDFQNNINDKIEVFRNLTFTLPYVGKFHEALSSCDKMINLAWQNKDTATVAQMSYFKSIFYLWGWNDLKTAKKNANKSSKYLSYLPYYVLLPVYYLYVGEYDSAVNLTMKKYGERFAIIPQSFRASKNNNCEQAEKLIQDISLNQLKIMCLYPLAECQFKNGKYENAVNTLDQLQTIYSNTAGFRSYTFPRSLYLKGKIYEKKGNTNLAIKNYEKFLDLWKNADEDLPLLIDGKKRLATLKGVL